MNIDKIHLISIVASFLLFFMLLLLIRKKRIKEEYSLLWMFFSLVFIVLSIWRNGLEYLSSLLGIAYPPAALFILLLLTIFLILIQFSVIISQLSDRIKILAQELALLKFELEKLRKELAGTRGTEGQNHEEKKPPEGSS
jgi:hypothetical protein